MATYYFWSFFMKEAGHFPLQQFCSSHVWNLKNSVGQGKWRQVEQTTGVHV